MAIEKEKFFEIICNVSKSKDLNEDNLLQKIKDELYEVEKKLPEEDRGEYNKFKNDLWKDHLFSIKTSEEIAEDWTLLHLAVACNSVPIVELLLEKKVSVNTQVKDGSDDGPTPLHIAASDGHENIIKLLLDDDRVNPSLKSKGKTPREMVGDVQNRDTIIKMLEHVFKLSRKELRSVL
ncbi:ankyrin repeat domain-containing protein [Wolbachia endosymbiont of Anurida maritima]|uniref:ankyrin repeat domain-containing protein n=1 Tax=Wolbachia endosymbiont of Anurida maritima TaxID=2850562 RepID=UPI0035CFF5DA